MHLLITLSEESQCLAGITRVCSLFIITFLKEVMSLIVCQLKASSQSTPKMLWLEATIICYSLNKGLYGSVGLSQAQLISLSSLLCGPVDRSAGDSQRQVALDLVLCGLRPAQACSLTREREKNTEWKSMLGK